MSESKKACMFSSQGEFRCGDPADTASFYDIPVGAPMRVQKANTASSYALNKPSIVENFTKNAPLFENFDNNEPVGLASGFVGQFQNLQ